MKEKYIRQYLVSNLGIQQAEQKKQLAGSTGYTERNFTDLHTYLEKGHKVAIGYHSSTTEKGSINSGSWYGQALFPIDFDNSPMPMSEVLERLKQFGAPLFAYETWSANSFRLVYQVTPAQAEAWEFLGHRKQWIVTKSFWLSLLEETSKLTGLTIGKTAKGANDYVIDTNITHKALVLNGTNKPVQANYDSYLSESIVSKLLDQAEQKAEKAIKAQERAEQRQETIKQAYKGKKWTLEAVEARCKEIGILSNMGAWVGVFNSLIAGIRLGFSDISEDEATSLFIAFCDNGKAENIGQYKAMRLNHKTEKANLTSFWGDTGGKPLEFGHFQKAFTNPIELGEKEFIKSEQILNDFEPFKKHLIVAPAGAGKSYSTIEGQALILERFKELERTVFTYPTEPAAKQAYEAAKAQLGADIVATQYDQAELREFENKQRKLLFCTYDRLAHLIQTENVTFYDLIVIDEVHLLNDYTKFKSKVTKIVKEIIGNELFSVIALTATPQALPIQLFDKVTAYTKGNNKRVTVAVTDKRYKSQLNFYLSAVKKQLVKGKKTLIYMNSKSKAEKLAQELEELLAGVGTVGVVHADNKIANKDFNAIVEAETLHNDVVIATKLINVAVNIKQTVGAIIAFNLYDITELMQLINRERGEADFILLYSPRQRRVPNFILQKKIDFEPLPKEKQHETITAHKQGDNYKLSSYTTRGIVTTQIRDIKGTHDFIVSFVFECWNEAYNNFDDLIKLLDPSDIQAYLMSIGIEAKYIENVKFEDTEQAEQPEEETCFSFKNVKGMVYHYNANGMKHIYETKKEQVHEHIDNIFRSEQRKLGKQLLEDIALDPKKYEVYKEQKIFLSFGHYKAFKETEKALETGETTNPIIKQIIKAKANNDVIAIEAHELPEIATFLGVDKITAPEVVKEIKKYVLVKNVRTNSYDENNKRICVNCVVV